MVSLGSMGKLAGVGLAIGLGYVVLKNAGGIGSAIGSSVGGGIAAGFGGLANSFQSAFGNLGGTTHTSAEQIAGTLGADNATNLPSNTDQTFASQRDNIVTNQLIGLSELFKGTNSMVDVKNRTLVGGDLTGKFVQPLDFIFRKDGSIRTGTEGVSPELLALQAELSAKHGIATFDIDGRLSTVNGLVSAR